MTVQLTEQQKNVLKYFEQLQKDLQYQPISQSYLPHQTSNKSIRSQNSQSPGLAPASLDIIPFIDPTEQLSSPLHKKLCSKLLQFKAKSNLIHSVSNLIHEYDINFKHLQKQRADLLATLENIHKDTSELIYKQKKYIDLANSVKEALDYYMLLDKFQFNWVCEPAAREVFEDQLQPLLSELTDGIEFFTLNSNYSNSKKYLNGLVAAKTKVTSFIKSFFIKLLNKQYGFSIKYVKNQLHKSIDGFYPKSKPKFLTDFLTCFPQFQKVLKVILQASRETGNESQSNALLRRQNEIEQFILNNNTLSLITYLQKNIPEVYQEVVLKFISYYRVNFHQELHRNIEIKSELGSEQKYEEHFREAFVQAIVILTCEAGYLEYCFKPCTELAREYARGTLTKIADFYSGLLVRMAKEPGKNKDPFKICNEVTYMLEECDKFLRNYSTRQYQTYAVGAIIGEIEEFGIDSLRSIFQMIGNKIINELQKVCQNMLPKFKQTSQKLKLTEQIKQFVKMIPNLSYCPSQAEKYLITSLDTITKSIKEVSNRIQSRLQCYAWNIQIFALIDSNLERLPYTLVKKETRIDVGETTKMIQKVKSVSRSENLMKYASDIFSVLKTGVPTLSELTLDFHTFIKEYFRQLKEKFVKDMVFVHAKNVIEFLQELKEANPQQASKLCEASMVKNLQSSYKLSIQNFISHAIKIIDLRKRQFAVFKQGEQLLMTLLREVQEALLDLMGTFYMETSKYTTQTQKFENIGELRAKYSLDLQKQGQAS